MNKKIIFLGIILILCTIWILYPGEKNNTTKDTNENFIHKNVQWAKCYGKDGSIVTVQHVNIYEAKFLEKWDYKKIEVFNKPGGNIIEIYEGKLYIDVKQRHA